MGAEVLDLLKTLQQDFGQSVLLVTHSDAAARKAERVHRLRDGVLEVEAVRG